MNGKRYLLDTNAIIALLQGNPVLNEILEEAEWVGISIISQFEFFAFPNLTENDKKIFNQFLQRVYVIGLEKDNQGLINNIIKTRRDYNIKLPDAIIASTAIRNNASVITNDKQFSIINELSVINF